MSQIKAISYSQKDCGKHVSDTKKRFAWIFQINEKSYTLELINSALSGKKTVLLNMEQIYHEKNILNIDFDFTYMIDGHSFRIYRIDEKINAFELRIDNRTFDEMRLGRHQMEKTGLTKQFSKKQSDPFAEFQKFSTKQRVTQNLANDFGDFDFDSFSKPSLNFSVTKIQKSAVQVTNNATDLLNFAQISKPTFTPVNDFLTNAFQTNKNGSFNNFANSFKQNENILDLNNSQFSTNAYANRNHYLDLNNNHLKSEKFDDNLPPVIENKQKNFWGDFGQNFGEYNKMAGLATKKAMNSAAIKLNQGKKNLKQFIGDLI